jgi:hypothetical protein
MLPEPEWSLLAQVARGDDSFALQLQGARTVRVLLLCKPLRTALLVELSV